MWKNIVKTYTAIDEFLIKCVDYVELRIKTGKVFGDLKQVSAVATEQTGEKTHTFISHIKTSPLYRLFCLLLKKMNESINKIPVLENFFGVLFSCLLILKKNLNEFLSIVIVSLLMLLFAASSLANNPTFFFLSILPMMLLNGIATSTFYYMVDKREKGTHISLLSGIPHALKTFFSITLLFFFTIFTIIDIVMVFFIFSFLISVIFDFLGISWQTSLIFWFFVIFVGFFSLILTFLLIILTFQAYYFVLFEKSKTFEALLKSWHQFRTYSFQFLFFYLFSFLCFSALIFWATVNYVEVGFVLAALALNHSLIMLGYVLRKRFPYKQDNVSKTTSSGYPWIFIFLIGLGMLSYTLFTILIVQVNPHIMEKLLQKQEEFFITRNFVTYYNKDLGYAIEHPQSWFVYSWNGESVTIYNNYTNTRIGSMSVTIDVSPDKLSSFSALYDHRAGLVEYDNETKNITTKITNLSIHERDAVKYTVTREKPQFSPEQPTFTQYEIHYMINKDDLIYDLVLITIDKDIEGIAAPLFEKMISSFRFIE